MKKSIIFSALLICFLSGSPAYAQLGWGWAFGEKSSLEAQGNDVVVDSLGNIYVAGYFGGEAEFGDEVLTAVSYHDFFIAKYDRLGELLWARQGGSSSYNFSNGVALDDSLNVYVTGSLNDKAESFVLKYDKEGNFKWKVEAGLGYHWENKGKVIVVVGDEIITASASVIWKINSAGSIVRSVGGWTTALSNYKNEKFAAASSDEIVLMDSGLNILRTYPVMDGIECVNAVSLNDSSIYFTGRYSGPMSIGDSIFTGQHNMFVAKMDTTGKIVWANQGGGVSYDVGHSLVINENRQLFVAGSYNSIATFDTVTVGSMGLFEEIFVAEYGIENGNLVDLIHAGGGGNFDIAYGIAETDDNQLAVTGSIKDMSDGVNFGEILVNSRPGNIDFFLAKTYQPEVKSKIEGRVLKSGVPCYSRIKLYRTFDDNTYELVYNIFTDSEGAFSLDISNKATYILKAHYYTQSHMSTYYQDEYLWGRAASLTIESDTILDSLDIDLIELPILTGTNTLSGLIYSGANQPKRFMDVLLVSSNDDPVAYALSDSAGVYRFENIPEGEYKVLVDTAGLFMDSYYTVNISDLKSTYTDYTGFDYVIREGMIYISGAISSINDPLLLKGFNIYPVPAIDVLYIVWSGNGISDATFDIIDLNGRIIRKYDHIRNNQIDLSDFKDGTYILRLVHDDSVLCRKFLRIR